MAVLAVLLTAGFLVWLQGFIYRRGWYRHLTLSMTFSEKQATEGDTLWLTEVITNRKLLPLPWLTVKFQVSKYLLFADRDNARVSDDYYRNDLFNLLMFQRITRKLAFVCGKRGFYTIKSAELVSADILARDKLTLPVFFNAALTVYPKTIDLDTVLSAHKPFLGQLLTKRYIQPDPFTFKGIREYQPHDSLRAVNFKATAKTGDLMVNVNDYTIAQEVVLVLNLQRYSAFLNDTLYENTLRLAASLAAYYVENAVPLSFITNARGFDLPEEGVQLESGSGVGHLNTINDALARLEARRDVAQSGAALLTEITRQWAQKSRLGREPAYVIVSTFHEPDFARAHAALCETGAEVLWLIPLTPDGEVTIPLTERVVRVSL